MKIQSWKRAITQGTIVLFLLTSFEVSANRDLVEQLSDSGFNIRPPTNWVEGTIGQFSVRRAECTNFSGADLRQRIVDIAQNEWVFFGSKEYQVQAAADESLPWEERRQRRPRLNMEESVRAAQTIAGYWSTTGEGAWIIERQNEQWEEEGLDARWQDAWSAAFISWVMCEAGIDNSAEFRHAIAHHSYIDQAIRARDGVDPHALYTAYDSGEAEVALGDLLCTGTRPVYADLEARRAQIGEGARTHCDIVVKIDSEMNTVDTIGGNVQSAVTLKTLWVTAEGRILSPVERDGRPVFAHLKLRTDD